MDEIVFWLLVLVLVLWTVPITVAVVVSRRARRPIEALALRVASLEARLAAGAAAAPAQEEVPGVAEAPEVEPAAPEPAEPEPVATSIVEPEPEPTLALPPREPVVAALGRIEERLMSRWLVWLGGLALALGSVFLVKYSIEQGWFGPAARIAGGEALGLGLLALGEWTRRRPSASAQPNYVPSALVAAGVVALFAASYAAYGLYQLIGALPAFVLLATIAAAAVLLSLVHGAFIALLGLIGAYLVPLLVSSEHPSIWGLVLYVFAVTAACLWLVRWREWHWLGWVAVAGAHLWGIVAVDLSTSGEIVPSAVYLLVLPAAFITVIATPDQRPWRLPLVWVTAALSGLLMVALVHEDGTSALAVAFATTSTLALLAFAWKRPVVDRVAWIAGVQQVLLLAVWTFARGPSGDPVSTFFALAPAQALQAFLGYALATALVFGLGGWLALGRRPNPERWAAASALMPVAAMVIAYWRSEQFAPSLPWGAAALALATAEVIAAEMLAPRRDSAPHLLAFTAYAVGAVASLSLGLTMSLRLGWLTVGLSLQLPALVWLYRRTGAAPVRYLAAGIAAIVLARLILNPAVADYDLGTTPILNGLLYTYGIPFVAMLVGARGFAREGKDWAVHLLEAGTLALGLAFVSLEIRHFAHGGHLGEEGYGLLEAALDLDAWLATAFALLTRGGVPENRVRAIGWRVIGAVAVLQFVLFPLIAVNPLFADEGVGSVPILDTLLFAYAVPTIFAALFARAFRRRGWIRAANVTQVAAVVLGFIYVSFEVRHVFQGPFLDGDELGDAEWYAYSLAWLVYGAALVVSGIYGAWPRVRLAGFAIGTLVSVKVFVFDAASLTGLYRAASFLGLGASLVALGYLHQRLSKPDAAR